MIRTSPSLTAAIVAAALLGAAPLAADDHDFAREAVKRGDILPLSAILERVARDFRGEMLEVELEREDHAPFAGRVVYEVTLLAPGGDITELYYEARTGELLLARGHNLEHSGRDTDDKDDEADGD